MSSCLFCCSSLLPRRVPQYEPGPDSGFSLLKKCFWNIFYCKPRTYQISLWELYQNYISYKIGFTLCYLQSEFFLLLYKCVLIVSCLSSVTVFQQQRVGRPASAFKAFSRTRSQLLQLHPHMHILTRTRWLSSLPFINYWFSISINIDCRLNSQFKLSSWVPIQGWHEPWALERLNYTPAPVSHPHPTYHTSTVKHALK